MTVNSTDITFELLKDTVSPITQKFQTLSSDNFKTTLLLI